MFATGTATQMRWQNLSKVLSLMRRSKIVDRDRVSLLNEWRSLRPDAASDERNFDRRDAGHVDASSHRKQLAGGRIGGQHRNNFSRFDLRIGAGRVERV